MFIIITAMHGKLQYVLMGLSSYLCWCIATGIISISLMNNAIFTNQKCGVIIIL